MYKAYSDLPLIVVTKSPFDMKTPYTYGIIIYCTVNERWLMVQRRHSVALSSILKGTYTPSSVPSFIKSMTREERGIISQALQSQDELERVMKDVGVSGSSHSTFIWNKMNQTRQIIERSISLYSDEENQLRWLWPKGYKDERFDLEDSPCNIAMRELKEEVGIEEIPHPYIISHNHIEYKTRSQIGYVYPVKCWVCIIRNQVVLTPTSDSNVEVRDKRWMTTDEVRQHLQNEEIEAFEKATSIVSDTLSLSP